MPTIEQQENVIRSLISESVPVEVGRRRIAYAAYAVRAEMFTGNHHLIYKVVIKYFMLTGGVISSAVLTDFLKSPKVKLLPDQTFEITRLWGGLVAPSPPHADEHVFNYHVSRLVEQTRADGMKVALTEAMEVLSKGKGQGDSRKMGYEDARHGLMESLAYVEGIASDMIPDGNVNEESLAVAAEYHDIKTRQARINVLTGIKAIDDLTWGAQLGELWLLGAYTGDGKTTQAVNIAWNAAYMQGKNVLFGSAEMLRSQVRRRLVCRHSHLEKFGVAGGLSSKAMKTGSLDANSEQLFKVVVTDMATNPHYGKFQLFQIPYLAPVSFVEMKMRRYEALWPIDLMVIDYINLIAPSRKRVSTHEEVSEVIRAIKQLAVTHAGGRGVPIISPYQMSREAWKEALKTRRYTKASLAASSEAEKSSDVIWSMLKEEEGQTIFNQVLKSRDSDELIEGFLTRADFDTVLITQQANVGGDSVLTAALEAP